MIIAFLLVIAHLFPLQPVPLCIIRSKAGVFPNQKFLIMAMTTLGAFTVTRFPKRTLAFVGHTGPYMNNPALFEELFSKVLAWAAPKGLLEGPGVESISIYHDDPEKVPPAKQRISVGFTVPAGAPAEGEIRMMEIPAGHYAVGSFEIFPDQYGAAWEEMMGFIRDENLSPAAGPMYESYKNDPRRHPEGKHLVDICVALRD